MSASPSESPIVARRRVRLALREARERLQLTQGEVARRLGWSGSKVQRIEVGDVSVSVTDARALLDTYGVVDQDEIIRITESTRISRRQRWWTAPEYRTHLTPGLRQLIEFEAEAVAIRAYQPVVVPGVLQTPAIAKYVLGWWDKSLSDDDRRVRFDVRRLRRQVIDRDDAPDYRLVLDESVLRRQIGGAEVMAEQLESLLDVASRPHVTIRIVPLEKGALVGMLGPFTVIDLSDEPDDAVLYRESFNQDFFSDVPKDVGHHRDVFEVLWKVALDEEASLDRIREQVKELRSQRDREPLA
jgi:transcriptional regulator with XRE-family HTH domain